MDGVKIRLAKHAGSWYSGKCKLSFKISGNLES